MTKYTIIGNMTGNSMDAIDLVMTEFDGDKMTDICSFTKAYSKDMQEKMNALRDKVRKKTRAQIMQIPEFQAIHDEYISQVADCINEMCARNAIDKKSVDAIGFHGKTLDHNPPSVDKAAPFTLQIGSGQMLADLTGIPVVYDFRSAPIMAGFDGAPLVPPHNAHVAFTEGDGCYYNGGNTSNLAWIVEGKAVVGSDAGPFNEYTDNFIRTYSKDTYDKDGKYGSKGKLDKDLLQYLFDKGREFYDLPLPRSGDPQYYHTKEIFANLEKKYGKFDEQTFCNIIHTFEYFAAYVAMHALTLTDKKIKISPHIILFGGGWKNPVVRQSFDDLLAGKGYVLPEHQKQFADFVSRAQSFSVSYSNFGEYMEARLFADLARYKLDEKAWEIPEIVEAGKKVVCGRVANPNDTPKTYTDYINRACCGWQVEAKAREQLKQKEY